MSGQPDAIRYPFIVDETPDGMLMATAPDLPGCNAGGRTLAELRINAADALRDWLDETRSQGGDIPAPFSSSEILLIGGAA